MHSTIPIIFIIFVALATGPVSSATLNSNATSIIVTSTNNDNANIDKINPYTKAYDELLLDLRQQMLTRAIKFDEHFRTLLSKSKRSLHSMFADTYGVMYEQNVEIFTSMFEGLEQYYANGGIKLTKSMENFFERLYQKIFQVFNQNRLFSPKYLECATEQLTHLKPFKDVPEKLIKGIRHAFIAARTFEQALNGGIDFIKNIISFGQPAICNNLISEKLLKNTVAHNPSSTSRAPCVGFCEQVIYRCIGRSNLEPLDARWKAYVSILGELATKLGNNYNIETIIAPLDVQISEAIMNFQENASNISQHVFQTCGQPKSNSDLSMTMGQIKPSVSNRLGKRATPSIGTLLRNTVAINGPVQNNNFNQQNPYGNSNSNNRNANSPRYPTNNQQVYRKFPVNNGYQPSSMSGNSRLREGGQYVNQFGLSPIPDDLMPSNKNSPMLIEEIKNYMLSTKTFWSNLPNSVCTSNLTLGSNHTTNIRKQTNSNCFTENFGTLDMNSELRYRLEFHKIVAKLEVMHTKIEQALLGYEIDWNNDVPKQQIILPNNSNNNPRLPQLSNSATSPSTTTVAPEIDENETDDDVFDPDTEEGSGTTDNSFLTDESTELEPDIDDNSDDLDGEQPMTDQTTEEEMISPTSQSPTESSPRPDLSVEDPFGPNSIDQPSILDDPISNLITPPDAQRSGQSSTILVINFSYQVLLLTSLVILLCNMNQHTDKRC